MKNPDRITIVIPTYNEAGNLPGLAAAVWDLPLPPIHLLIVDDSSPDGTADVARDLAARHPGRMSVMQRTGKLGLGTAYIAGFREALRLGADFIGQMDADFSHAPGYLPSLVAALQNADVVFGSRYIEGGRLDERWSPGRRLLSRFGNLYARTILGLQARDVTGGYRMWRRATLAALPLDRIRSNGYVFQVEMAYVAQLLGFRHVECPIYFEDRRLGESKMSFRIQVEAAVRVWQVLGQHRRLTPADRRPG